MHENLSGPGWVPIKKKSQYVSCRRTSGPTIPPKVNTYLLTLLTLLTYVFTYLLTYLLTLLTLLTYVFTYLLTSIQTFGYLLGLDFLWLKWDLRFSSLTDSLEHDRTDEPFG